MIFASFSLLSVSDLVVVLSGNLGDVYETQRPEISSYKAYGNDPINKIGNYDLNDIEELCSRIIIIDKGKKIYDGEIEILYNTRKNKL